MLIVLYSYLDIIQLVIGFCLLPALFSKGDMGRNGRFGGETFYVGTRS